MKPLLLAFTLPAALLLPSCGRQQQFTEQEVAGFVTPGRVSDAILIKFGQPGSWTTNAVGDVTMTYLLPDADESVHGTFRGFEVRLTNGVVAASRTIHCR